MGNVCCLKSFDLGDNSDDSGIIVPILVNFPSNLKVSAIINTDFVELVIDSADLASGSVDARTVDGHVIGVFFHE